MAVEVESAVVFPRDMFTGAAKLKRAKLEAPALRKASSRTNQAEIQTDRAADRPPIRLTGQLYGRQTDYTAKGLVGSSSLYQKGDCRRPILQLQCKTTVYNDNIQLQYKRLLITPTNKTITPPPKTK